MDADYSSFWPSEPIFDAVVNPDTAHHHHHSGVGFHGHMSPIFSPMPPEYTAILDSIEMGLHVDENDGVVVLPPWLEDEGGGGGGGGGGGEAEAEEEEEEEEEDTGGGGKTDVAGGNIPGGCKNLLTERNRRMKLNQQLLALRLLVPCISKMDKRSILIDAAEYLQGLLDKIQKLERERSQETPTSNLDSDLSPSSEGAREKLPEPAVVPHRILQIDTEQMDKKLFTVKVVFKRARGAQAQVQRVLESLEFDISNTTIQPIDRHEMLTTAFIHVKRQIHLTEESLRSRIIEAAVKCEMTVMADATRSLHLA